MCLPSDKVIIKVFVSKCGLQFHIFIEKILDQVQVSILDLKTLQTYVLY